MGRTNVIKHFLSGFALVIITSLFLFPVGFRGLPESLNGKQILAVLGMLFFLIDSIKKGRATIDKRILISCLFACIFSLWCLFCVVLNNSEEFIYATYIRAFAIWLFAAYAVIRFLSLKYERVDLSVITRYLAIVCVAQCVLAELVEYIPSFRLFVDTWFIQDPVAKELDRLYGIGASLDSAGVRFNFVLILIAHQIVSNSKVTQSRLYVSLYVLAIILIGILGNMIARTTTVGLALAIIYILFGIGISKRGVLSRRQIVFYTTFFCLIITGVAICVFLYNTNSIVRDNLRFAFEGFFNLFETGEFRTDSSDRLNSVMWIWPFDTHGWLVGYGVFSNRDLGLTDIGYCRFALYCGIPGIILFSLYFIYNASTIPTKFQNSQLLAILMLALTFIVWIKVSTDIFQVYALLFWLASDYDSDGNLIKNADDGM